MKDKNMSHFLIGLGGVGKRIPKIPIPIVENDDKFLIIDTSVNQSEKMEIIRMNSDKNKELEEMFEDLFGDLDMENMDEVSDNIIILNDENGDEVEFEFLDLIEFENEEYVILLPMEDDETGEVVILKVEEISGSDEESYESVEDEEKLQAVFEIFKDKFKDEFNFVD